MTTENHAIVFTQGTDDPQTELRNFELASVVGGYLHNTFPGYLWRVNADIKGGIVNILCHDVSTEMGCTIKIAKLVDPIEGQKLVHKAGGEILERARLHRGRMREDEVATASRDIRGNIINLN